MEALLIATLVIVLLNCLTTYSLLKKARHIEAVLARYENREYNRLQRDTMEALTLLRTGKIEEAKAIAERIVTS
jgi:hypothetical protein